MNISKIFTITFLFIFCAAAYGQTTQSLNEKPVYDAELAKKVGADEYGMKTYVFATLKKGKLNISDPKEREKLLAGHMANIERLAKERKLVLAGPFLDEQDIRGIFVFDVRTLEEAKQLVETDPSVKAGLFDVELRLWFGTAALLTIPETHEKVAKKKFED